MKKKKGFADSVNSYLSRFFNPLEEKDIQEKVDNNLKKMSITDLEDNLYQELIRRKRLLLNQKTQMLIQQIQMQNLEEQLRYIRKRCKENAR